MLTLGFHPIIKDQFGKVKMWQILTQTLSKQNLIQKLVQVKATTHSQESMELEK